MGRFSCLKDCDRLEAFATRSGQAGLEKFSLMPPSLLTSVDSTDHVHLIIGSNPLASARCAKSIEAGARPMLIAPKDSIVHYGLRKRIDDKQISWIERDFQDDDLKTWGRAEVDGYVDAVFVTLDRRDPRSTHISNLCRRLRIPVNVADSPILSTFTLLSTHTDGPLQIGVTTSGRGCKLSARIKRELVAALPDGTGAAVSRLGSLRRRLQQEDEKTTMAHADDVDGEEEDSFQPANFNQLVSPGTLGGAQQTHEMAIADLRVLAFEAAMRHHGRRYRYDSGCVQGSIYEPIRAHAWWS